MESARNRLQEWKWQCLVSASKWDVYGLLLLFTWHTKQAANITITASIMV